METPTPVPNPGRAARWRASTEDPLSRVAATASPTLPESPSRRRQLAERIFNAAKKLPRDVFITPYLGKSFGQVALEVGKEVGVSMAASTAMRVALGAAGASTGLGFSMAVGGGAGALKEIGKQYAEIHGSGVLHDIRRREFKGLSGIQKKRLAAATVRGAIFGAVGFELGETVGHAIGEKLGAVKEVIGSHITAPKVEVPATATATVTETPTPTATASATATITSTPIPTVEGAVATGVPTIEPTSTVTPTETPFPTATPEPSPTAVPGIEPSSTPVATLEPSPTAVPAFPTPIAEPPPVGAPLPPDVSEEIFNRVTEDPQFAQGVRAAVGEHLATSTEIANQFPDASDQVQQAVQHKMEALANESFERAAHEFASSGSNNTDEIIQRGNELYSQVLTEQHDKLMEAAQQALAQPIPDTALAEVAATSVTDAASEVISSMPTELILNSGSNPWEASTDYLRQALGREPSNEEILSVTKAVARSSGISVPQWGISGPGFVSDRQLPVGFKLVFDDNVKSVIKSMINK